MTVDLHNFAYMNGEQQIPEVVRAALAGRRSQAQFVMAIVTSALATIALAAVLLLSGII